MKTAISIPNALFDSADALASRLGVSRSQLYATALARFLAAYESDAITAQLDAIYADPAGEPSRLEPGFKALQGRALRRADNPAAPEEW